MTSSPYLEIGRRYVVRKLLPETNLDSSFIGKRFRLRAILSSSSYRVVFDNGPARNRTLIIRNVSIERAYDTTTTCSCKGYAFPHAPFKGKCLLPKD